MGFASVVCPGSPIRVVSIRVPLPHPQERGRCLRPFSCGFTCDANSEFRFKVTRLLSPLPSPRVTPCSSYPYLPDIRTG